MKYLILLAIFLRIKLSSSQDCALLNNDNNNKPLDLTENAVPQIIGTFKKDFPIGNTLPGKFTVVGLDLTNIEDAKTYCKASYFFMNFDKDQNTLSFSLTNEFSQFDDDVIDQPKIDGCYFLLNFKADSSCGITNGQIILKYMIEDVNKNEPHFDQSTYDLHITFPVAKGISLLKLSTGDVDIKATDKDFSTQSLTFEIVEENAKTLFGVEALTSSSHSFPVDIKAHDLIYLQEPITFTLRATDDGSGPLSSSTEIKITLNEDSEPPVPEFESYFFQGKVDLDNAQVDDIITDPPIKLKENYKNPKFDCNGNDVILMNYFACEQQGDTAIVKLIKIPDETLWHQNQVPVLKVSASITTDIGTKESTNDVPLIIMIENIPEGTGTTTTESGSTGNTNPTDGDTNPTEGDTNPTEDPTSAPECTEKDPDSDLITVIIILSIIACVLLLALAYGYFKYVRGRKSEDKAHLLDSNSRNNEDDISNNNSETSDDKKYDEKRSSVDSETYSKPLDALPQKDEIQIQNEIDREPKGLDRLIAEQEENNLLKPAEVKSRKRSMTFSESDDESRQYRENLSEPVTSEIINENKPDPVRKKSAVTFKL